MIEMESRLLSQLCRAEVPRDSVLRRDERGMKKLKLSDDGNCK